AGRSSSRWVALISRLARADRRLLRGGLLPFLRLLLVLGVLLDVVGDVFLLAVAAAERDLLRGHVDLRGLFLPRVAGEGALAFILRLELAEVRLRVLRLAVLAAEDDLLAVDDDGGLFLAGLAGEGALAGAIVEGDLVLIRPLRFAVPAAELDELDRLVDHGLRRVGGASAEHALLLLRRLEADLLEILLAAVLAAELDELAVDVERDVILHRLARDRALDDLLLGFFLRCRLVALGRGAKDEDEKRERQSASENFHVDSFRPSGRRNVSCATPSAGSRLVAIAARSPP